MILPHNAFFAGLLAGAALLAIPPQAMAGPAPATEAVKIDVRQFTLPNGLTAIVYTDHTVPSVYVGMRYRTGSKDEPAGRSGFAHLFEHLMFQSTSHRKGGFLPALAAIGASDINGQTTTDWTEYHETVPTNALDYALWMEADRMRSLADGLTQQELDEQRGVVQNEKRQGELRPGARAGDRYLAGYYPAGHPYAHSVIGSMEDLDRATLADVKQWFTDYYGASNAVIVLAGDIDFEAARAKITRYFGAARPGKAIDRVDQWLPSFGDVKRETLYDTVGVATISRSWPVSNQDAREKTLLQLAARTMAGSANTPLVRALVEREKVALGVHAELDESALGSSFTLSVTLRPGIAPDVAGAALDRSMAQFLAQGPDQKQLGAVIAASDVALLRLMERAPSVGGWLLGSTVEHGDPVHFLKQRDWIGAATVEQVRAASNTWLARPYYELRLLPAPSLQAAAAGAEEESPPPVAPLAAELHFPPLRQTQLANGLKIVVAERRRLPILDAELRFATGTLAEPADTPGAASAALAMMDQGSRNLDATAFAARLSALGMRFSAEAGERNAVVRWSATTRTAAESFALAAAAIRDPAYPQARVEDRIQADRSRYDGLVRNPVAAASLLYARAMWGAGHPLGRLPSPGQTSQLDAAAIHGFHDRELGPDNATLYLVGNITLEQARALAQREFGNWKPVRPSRVAATPPAAATTAARVILIDAPGASQASITAGHFVAPYDPAQAPVEQLIDAVLGSSFDSRLNVDLRERKGWAYGFSAGINDATAGPRLFTASGTVQADKAAASMVEIRDQVRDYVGARPITAEELQREKTAAMRSIPLGYGGNAAFLNAIVSADAHGQPLDDGAGVIGRLSQVTLAQARALAANRYRADALTWVVVGDLARIEPAIRALDFGPLEIWDVSGKRLR